MDFLPGLRSWVASLKVGADQSSPRTLGSSLLSGILPVNLSCLAFSTLCALSPQLRQSIGPYHGSIPAPQPRHFLRSENWGGHWAVSFVCHFSGNTILHYLTSSQVTSLMLTRASQADWFKIPLLAEAETAAHLSMKPWWGLLFLFSSPLDGFHSRTEHRTIHRSP